MKDLTEFRKLAHMLVEACDDTYCESPLLGISEALAKMVRNADSNEATELIKGIAQIVNQDAKAKVLKSFYENI